MKNVSCEVGLESRRWTIELTSFATTEDDSAKLLEVAPALHPVIERIADGARHGRAEAYDEGPEEWDAEEPLEEAVS